MLTAEDRGPGAVVSLPAEGGLIKVRADVRSIIPVETLDILFNGRVLATKDLSGNRQESTLEIEATLTQSGWLAARCWSRDRLADGQVLFAHTTGLRSPRQPLSLSSPGYRGCRCRAFLEQTGSLAHPRRPPSDGAAPPAPARYTSRKRAEIDTDIDAVSRDAERSADGLCGPGDSLASTVGVFPNGILNRKRCQRSAAG